MKRFKLKLVLATALTPLFVLVANVPMASAAYNSSYLISDKLFTDNTSMSAASIQNFLNSKNSGLKNYTDVEDCGPLSNPHHTYYTTYYNCGNSSAAQIIYDAAQAYQISPKAILATLQKEQSLVTNPSPTQSEINCAMGYNSCSGFAGFFSQVDNGAWQFRTYIELMNGRNYWGYVPSQYPCANASSLYSTGLYPGRSVTFANPGGLARTVTLGNSATAGLYCYTPHVGPYSETGYSGSYNFVTAFEQWFGSVSSPCYNDVNLGVSGGGHIVRRNVVGKGKADNLALSFLNNTGSACIESHTWSDNSYQTWSQNLATNHPAVNPADDEVITADLNGDGRSELLLIKLRNSVSGKIEVHQWDSTLQAWASNLATNYPAVDPAAYRVIAADLNGDGKDELVLVKYIGGESGKVEVFPWSPGYQSFSDYIATNIASLSPGDNQIIAANTITDGGPRDKLILIKYRNTASGKIEIHTWNPGEQSWYSNVASNHPAVDPADDEVIAADTNGDGKDELLLIKYRNSGSGKIEIHTWGPQQQTWLNNQATQMPTISP
jgi:hypothetical protein